jgi:hypothetical protein
MKLVDEAGQTVLTFNTDVKLLEVKPGDILMATVDISYCETNEQADKILSGVDGWMRTFLSGSGIRHGTIPKGTFELSVVRPEEAAP